LTICCDSDNSLSVFSMCCSRYFPSVSNLEIHPWASRMLATCVTIGFYNCAIRLSTSNGGCHNCVEWQSMGECWSVSNIKDNIQQWNQVTNRRNQVLIGRKQVMNRKNYILSEKNDCCESGIPW
jgi:hypothetical protein